MNDREGPWGREEPEAPRSGWKPPKPPAPGKPARERRVLLWLAVLLGLALLTAGLVQAFPEATRTPQDWAGVAYALALLAFLSTRLLNRGGPPLGRSVRHAAIWVAILGGLALVVAFRDEIASVPQRLRLAFSDGAPVATGHHELTIPQDPDAGGFVVVGAVNGQRVSFIVDTGATDTVLAPDDARRIGLDFAALKFDGQAETANGVGRGAPFVGKLQIGPIVRDNFRMAVNQAPMSRSLLGLSFLNGLESYEVRGRTLILRWKD